jgi:hypothetical protein
MDVLQANASAVPDYSVGHVAKALDNMKVTAPAAATVPRRLPSTPQTEAPLPLSRPQPSS